MGAVTLRKSHLDYVRREARKGGATPSGFVGKLIAADQKYKATRRRDVLEKYLAACDAQIDRGEIFRGSVDDILASAKKPGNGKRRRAAA